MVSFVLSLEWVEERRKSLRPLRSKPEILLGAYNQLLQRLLEPNVINVNKITFSHDQYKQEVQALLAQAEGF
jgi:hypothetical protein